MMYFDKIEVYANQFVKSRIYIMAEHLCILFLILHPNWTMTFVLYITLLKRLFTQLQDQPKQVLGRLNNLGVLSITKVLLISLQMKILTLILVLEKNQKFSLSEDLYLGMTIEVVSSGRPQLGSKSRAEPYFGVPACVACLLELTSLYLKIIQKNKRTARVCYQTRQQPIAFFIN